MVDPHGRPQPGELVAVPKVLLHDHLDGGLRPQTIVELAGRQGYRHLPTTDPGELRRWFGRARTSGSLPDYLSGFPHAYGVLQTREALARAARENVEDLAADGIIYAETRFAPEFHGRLGLTQAQALKAVLAGTTEGIEEAAARGHLIDVRVIVCAMRHLDQVTNAAHLVAGTRDPRVVGFDIAGPEAGHPAGRFRDTCRRLRDGGAHLTIHAGEGDGVESIRQAVLECGAERLGHGTRITDDLDGDVLGPVARQVRDRRIVLEMSPSSNVHSGAAPAFSAYPALRLARLGFAVTINTDNRLMSQTTLSQEFAELVHHQDLSWHDIEEMTRTAANAAFLPAERRQDLDARITAWFRR